MKYPVRGQVYSSEDVLTKLRLDDSPFFMFVHEGKRCVVQHSHVTDEQLLEQPQGFRHLTWKYLRTTEEWIPIFDAVDNASVYKCVDIEPTINAVFDDDPFWVTPKGLPREQYHYPYPDPADVIVATTSELEALQTTEPGAEPIDDNSPSDLDRSPDGPGVDGFSPQPAELEPDEDCEFCDGTGEADSGGIHPWGAQASIRCRCTYPDYNKFLSQP